ncbi:hypothetical protein Cantr_06308 [Candida viswanathii]|uniref:Androgen-induced gene 1 protein n=1 Tax=Candida viswanathii TaxID=5486 RepID=A0A367XUL5_9ASCO|nr:hypothetical protein Cantr_06308 [Candida viswanathii]
MARQGLISILSLVYFIYGLTKCVTQPLPPHLIQGGHFQFLTNVLLVLTILYVLQTIVTPTSRHLRTQHNVVASLEFTVTVTYWTLFLLVPSWLNPADEWGRDWVLDVAIHLWPFVYLVVFDNQDRIPPKRAWGLTGAVIVVYWCYLERVVSVNAGDGVTRFAYPFLNDRTLTQRFGWMVLIWVVSCLNYYVIGLRNML